MRQYTVSEFELEYGEIQVHTLDNHIVKTEKGVDLILAQHLQAAIEKELITLSRSSIKNFVTNLFEYTDYDEDGFTIKKKKWVLFASDMKYSRNDNNRYILYKRYNYKRISERNNFCDFYIQCEENGEARFICIDRKTDIKVFTNDPVTKTYILETSRGKIQGKYISDSFIGAFIKLMDYPTTSNDEQVFNFYLYMDGRFEKYNKNVVAIF